MSRQPLFFLSILFALFTLTLLTPFTSLVRGESQTVFGPRDLGINAWHFHFSRHIFDVDDPGNGILVIENNTPEKEITGGFVLFNSKLISLCQFFQGDDPIIYKDIELQSTNSLIIFLGGSPEASVSLEVRRSGGFIPPPDVVFLADPMSISIGNASTLSWQATHADIVIIDHDIGKVALSGSEVVTPQKTTTYIVSAIGPGGSTIGTVTVTVAQLAPTVAMSADPQTILVGESAALSWTSSNADSCVIEPDVGTVDPTGSTGVSPTDTTTYTITATGPGGTAADSVTVQVDDSPKPPTVTLNALPVRIAQGESSTLSWTSMNGQDAHIDNGIGVVSVNGSSVVSPNHTTTYTITVTGSAGSASAQAVVMVTGNPEPQPEAAFGRQYEDLIPSDVTAISYNSKRFSLITGLVHDQTGAPIADVAVTIHGHPEYGTVTTDREGQYTIPVEGGGTMTLGYHKAELLAVHRKVYVPWNDIAVVEAFQMIAQDPKSTTVTFDGNPDTVVTHQSTEVTDAFGNRTCTMVFTGDNHAYLVDENGDDVHELTAITARATEYTTPESMPAKLPSNSAYTYCVELSVDNASRVRFERPVIMWVNNFLSFDVGMAVPVGFYDRDRAAWVPSDNGVVVELLDTNSDGTADALDADGNGQPDDLNGDGFYNDEVSGLNDSQRYPPGAAFWRFAAPHFTPWDCNWPYGPPPGAVAPNAAGIPQDDEQKENALDCPDHNSSLVEQRSRIFHEDLPVPGTELTLHYASNRVEGYKAVLTVPASGDTVPDSLKKIVLRVDVAGCALERILDSLPNQVAEIVWDGKNHLGRQVVGPANARVSVGFVYDALYYGPGNFARAFAQAGRDITAIPARQEVISWIRSEPIRLADPKGTVAEGWGLSVHHASSMVDPGKLYRGDGTTISHNAHLIDTAAGNGSYGYGGDGGSAVLAQLSQPFSVAVDAEGNLYVADFSNHAIRKVDTDGVITTVAEVGSPHAIAVDAQENLYVASSSTNRIYKVVRNGTITTLAGTGVAGYSGDGGPAVDARLSAPHGTAIDEDGNLYIADYFNHRIRKVDTNGIITTVAGTGVAGYSGDGGPAPDARISAPQDIALDGFGNLYIADGNNYRIRKVNTNGVITTTAGTGIAGFRGDGGKATQSRLDMVYAITTDAAGNLFIADTFNHRIRKVDTKGIITTVAGSGPTGWGQGSYSGDGGPAVEARLRTPYGVAADPEGSLFIADSENCRIRKVTPPSAMAGAMAPGGTAFAQEGGRGYVLDSNGRHKATIDLDTGTVLRQFDYNEDNQLISITDRFAGQITIVRDLNGLPTAIISPDGVTTSLTIDSNNHLTHVAYPDGSLYSFEYTWDGLMTAKVEPGGNRFEHVFDPMGRLTETKDHEGGDWHYTRTGYESGDILMEVLSAEGNITSYLDHIESTGAYTSTITDPTGAETLFDRSGDGLTVAKSLPCGMDLELQYGIDSEYLFKYVKKIEETSPASLTKTTLRARTYEDTDTDEIPDLITETITVNGKAIALEDDVIQSEKTMTSPEGRTVTTTYDPVTLLTSSLSIPGLYDTTYGYNTRGRLTWIITNTRETSFAYNAQGFLESITDPQNNTTSYTYDAVGRMTGINRPDATTVGFTYDQNGNMTVLTNPSAVAHIFRYNGVNRNSSYQTPLSGSYTYVYDKDRRLIQTNFPSGNQINNIYSNGRLEQIQIPEGNIDLTYICSTKFDSITNEKESITYGYDGKLLESEALSGTLSQTLSYGYNNDFNLTSSTYAGGTEHYTYDSDGLLTEAGGFVIRRNAGNGLPESVAGGAVTLARTFNGYGEVDGRDFTINNSSLANWSLTRNHSGRITAKTETVDGIPSIHGYTYDLMGRLLTVTKDGSLVEAYQYGPNSTRIYEMNALRGISGRTLDYSDEDCLLTAGTTTYQYDVDGFLTTKTQGADVTIYDYASRGELLGVTLADGRTIEYIHDPLGRRIAKKVNGIVIKKYLWQGFTRLLAVYDGIDNLVMRFQYADDRMPVAMTQDGSTYYLAYDQVGSLRMVVDASGNVVKRIEYDAFGNILTDTNPTFSTPFGFAGGLHDTDTGLVRFGFRDYDPDVGRWTAKDPILFAGGDTDLYGYCLNDPIGLLDPLGLLEVHQYQVSIFGNRNAGLINFKAKTETDLFAGSARSGVESSVAQLQWKSDKGRLSGSASLYKWRAQLKGGMTNIYSLGGIEAAAKIAAIEGKTTGSIRIGSVFFKGTLGGTLGSLGAEGKFGMQGLRMGFHALVGLTVGLEWGFVSELPCK